MSRIFLALGALSFSLFCGNILLAVTLGDFGARSREYSTARARVEEAKSASGSAALEARTADLDRISTELAVHRNRFWPHIWLGIAASLISLLVNSISITYFIGTNRWCREVADAYGMQRRLTERSANLKRRSSLWAFLGIALTILIAGTGGAADPFSSSAEPAAWVVWHWTLAMGGTMLIGWAFYAQYLNLCGNHELIQEVLVEAERIRAERETMV